MENKIFISFGNKKLPDTTAIFNLPCRITCPMSTAYCRKVCYAQKAEYLYPQVLPLRKNNFKLSLSDQFPLLMIDTIKKVYPDQILNFRIHESGDFYNQVYLNKWYEIIRVFPKLVFYSYTRSLHLNFSDKPDNLRLIFSCDHTTEKKAFQLFKAKQAFFDSTFQIVPKDQKALCRMNCRTCFLCLKKRRKGKIQRLTVHKH